MAHPAMLIHGMWSTGADWGRVIEGLRPHGYDCFAPDLPGHRPGADDAGVGALSLRDYVDFLEAELQARQYREPPVIIGHSMGGLLAALLATRVQALALVLLAPAPPAGINALSGSALDPFLPMLLRSGFWRRPYKPSYARYRRAMAGSPEESVRQRHARLCAESGRAICEIGLWPLDRRRASRVDTAALRCPIHVTSGGLDRMVPPRVVRRVARQLGAAQLRHWPDRGHYLIDDEHTGQMLLEIVGWLRPLHSRAAGNGQRRVARLLPEPA